MSSRLGQIRRSGLLHSQWRLFETNFPSEASEHRLYTALLAMSSGLEERLNTGTEEDLIYVATMVRTPYVGVDPLPIIHDLTAGGHVGHEGN
jgi:hypothetical protein